MELFIKKRHVKIICGSVGMLLWIYFCGVSIFQFKIIEKPEFNVATLAGSGVLAVLGFSASAWSVDSQDRLRFGILNCAVPLLYFAAISFKTIVFYLALIPILIIGGACIKSKNKNLEKK